MTEQLHSAVCPLCPQHCVVAEGGVGRCRARGCLGGRMTSLTYGQVAAMHVDPIEKKPLFHFYPGSSILSVGGNGCNLRCSFCQNYEISQQKVRGRDFRPAELAGVAQAENSLGICFTYSEPLVWFETVLETAALVKEAGGKTVLVTNGVIMPRYLGQLLDVIDAVNIDVKAFTDEFYRTHTGGRLSWVLRSVELLAARGIHFEVSTLVIPGLNDGSEEIRGLAKYLRDLGVPLAWHLNRYYPAYMADYPPTPEQSLRKLATVGREYLPYVYLGNLRYDAASGSGMNTLCPTCQSVVVDRRDSVRVKVVDGKCPQCSAEIWGIWQTELVPYGREASKKNKKINHSEY
ncbi:MAG: AmmeMemoRadiSam system radical SAM enzyme [Peptococcaceae bacterium]|nr:AmmeMemoRadiSam system radical SAM enzyme [Peptococcaceae bacterium]